MPAVGIVQLGLGLLSAAWPSRPLGQLKLHSSGRYLVDQGGTPFLGFGASPWNIAQNLNASDQALYLRDRASRGCNMCIVGSIDNQFTANPSTGANTNGDLPFTTVWGGGSYTNATTQNPDFSTPNEAYWQYVDATLNRVALYGNLIFLYPSWIGNPVGGPSSEGYYNAMVLQCTGTGTAPNNMVNYGKFVARRYGAGGTNPIANLVWAIGGDNNPVNTNVNSDIATGITSILTSPAPLMYVDGLDGSGMVGTWGGSSWFNLNGIYSDQLVGHNWAFTQCINEYNASSTLSHYAQFWKEGCYEGDHLASFQFLRSQNWQAMLTGCWGFNFGVEPVWAFTSGWQAMLGSTSTVHAQLTYNYFRVRPWWLLVPDAGTNTFLTNGASYSGATFASAARASDGSWGAIYVPTSENMTVDLSGFRNNVTATWVDPTNGATQSAGVTNAAASGSHTFASTPGNNAAGDADWVLSFSVAGT